MGNSGNERFDVDALLAELTIEEKAALCSGSGFWHTRAVERLGIPQIMVSDGPHGLRQQVSGDGDHLGLDASVPATCFPPAVTVASSWNLDVARRIGDAIGVEARAAGIGVVLGPGINIKRSPLCGRNFEYFSEDPLLAGELGTAWVEGLQSHGVGASLKHFAVNNQESDRLRVSAEVDERTLREIYLAAFERIVTRAQPWTVMCSYNRINGVYASQDRWLLTDLLRDEWGFEGLVVSDWGAVDDCVAAVQAGLDLEMPSTGGVSARALVSAVADGSLDEAALDLPVTRLLGLLSQALPGIEDGGGFDADAHHAIARAAATEGAVLLKNSGDVLPLNLAPGQRIAVIGALAADPRYQGAGSSQVNPTRVDDALGALRAAVADGVSVDFAPGYTLPGSPIDEGEATPTSADLVHDAVEQATGADAVVVFLGLPAVEESEGFDRTHLSLPANQLALLAAVGAVHDGVVVVLANGGVVTTSEWDGHAAAVLECWLGGQASGSAVADLLVGIANPSGKLAETIPLRLEDNPSFGNFPGENRVVRHGEGLFVGYRHYDTVGRDVAHPFGFGLSYTTFSYDDLSLEVAGGAPIAGSLDGVAIEVGATITNTGPVAGAEVVQVYVGTPDATVPRPVHELRAFTKVRLEPGESQRVTFRLGRRDLARWSTRSHGWVFDPGCYEVAVAASSRDRRLVGTIDVPGATPAEPLDRGSTLAEWLAHPIGHDVLLDALRNAPGGDLSSLLDDRATLRMIGPFPMVRLLSMMGGAFSPSALDDLLAETVASGEG
jgi:beta-glucosidase